MPPGGARLVVGLDAAFHGLLALVLVLSSWDGLYDALDLPKPNPALLAQLGGIAVGAFAYLVWLALDNAALLRPAVRAAAVANAAGAVAIGLWLVLRGKDDLMVGTSGIVVLAALAVVLAVFALGEAAVIRRQGPSSPPSGG